MNTNFDVIGQNADRDLRQRVKVEGVRNGYRRYAVQSSSLQSIMERFGVDTVDLLKMDCEGCEYEVLRELQEKPRLVQRIKHVAGEIHGCHEAEPNQARCAEAVKFLRKTWPHNFHEMNKASGGSLILV